MAAANATLALPELLEMILLAPDSITILDLLHCRQVSQTWRLAIDRSRRLKKRMHLIPELASHSARVCDTLPPYATGVSFKQCAALDDIKWGDPDDDDYSYPYDDDESHYKDGTRPFRIGLDFPYRGIQNRDTDKLKKILLLQPSHQIFVFKVTGYSRGASEDRGICIAFKPARSEGMGSKDIGEIATIGAVVDAAKIYKDAYPRVSRDGRGLERIRVTAFVRPAGEDIEGFGGAAEAGAED